MSLNLAVAGRMEGWLVQEGKRCRSAEEDVDSSVDRFFERWPRVNEATLDYVSQMLFAQLHVRTVYPLKIVKAAQMALDSRPRRRWWQIRPIARSRRG